MEALQDGRKVHENQFACLYPELLTIVFNYLSVKEKGRVSQVCVKWRDVAYNPIVWRGVEAKLGLTLLRQADSSLFSSIVKRGIKRVRIDGVNLDLNEEPLKKSLRDVIVGIPNVESLNLSTCFNVTDGALAHGFSQDLPCITVLKLNMSVAITDEGLWVVANSVKNLEVLELGGCRTITNAGLQYIAWGQKNLKTLNLRSCKHISDEGIGYVVGLNSYGVFGALKLENLCLQDLQEVTDHALKYISNSLCNLKTIDLSFCRSVTDSGVQFLSTMKNLLDLNLRSCVNISDVGLGYLAEGNSQITRLNVSFCDKIGDEGFMHLAQGLFSLQKISLCGCNITDEGLNHLVTTSQEITTLDIAKCDGISDKALIDLYECKHITTVDLQKIMQLRGLTKTDSGLWHKR